jgi:inosine-uridine nucleoside N-ribohydrolase
VKTGVIHDCDPGNDDALGILVAAGHLRLDIAAVTTGAGHLAAERTARNAAIAVAMTGRFDVPVTAGAALPLLRERLIATVLDHEGGLDAERHDLPAAGLDERHSVDLIADLAAARAGLTVAATGPLTNLALAFRLHPDLPRGISRIVALGGAWGLGNKTAAAEWNVLSDPEAAAIVFGSGVPVTMIPIDATAAVTIDDALLHEVEAIGGPVARFAVDLMQSLRRTHRPAFAGPRDAPLNDPLALLVAADPSMASIAPARVAVELGAGPSYGRTVVDFACRGGPANCDVVTAFDVGATRAAFVAALASLATAVAGNSRKEMA